VPACGPDLKYMMSKFPLAEVIGKVLSGSGECAEAGWTFLGLTIAGWSLAWFVIIGAFILYLTILAVRPAR
jgi:protein dithiol:quinone oxidoreductase